MKKLINNSKLFLILSLPLLIFSACSGGQQLTSLSPAAEITIDGQPNEWENQLSYIEDEKCAVGFKNDDKYIYICFETADKSKIMKILSMGLTVWMEPEDGKVLGVRYPQRMPREEMRMKQPGTNNQQRFDDVDEMNGIISNIISRQTDLSIINEDEFPLYAYPINDPFGFQVHLGYSMGKLIYELRIPYGSNALASIIIDAYPGENFNIQFETGEIDKTEMAQRGGGIQAGGGGADPGGMGGRGGGMRSGRGGMKHGGGEAINNLKDPFELKLDVVLAK